MSRLSINKFYHFVLLVFLLSLLPATASALPLEKYAANSVLSSGNWVKIKITETGIHLLTNESLRQMGFSDPSMVRVYGYGAMRLPEQLGNDYLDDLPMVQSVQTDRGIFFFATGPVGYEQVQTGRWRQTINPFTTAGYYFLSDKEAELGDIPSVGLSPIPERSQTTFVETVYHESELFNPGQTGHLLLGEEFVITRSRNFDFSLTDNVSSEITIECSFAAKSNAKTSIAIGVDGSTLPSTTTDNISSVSDSSHGHYNLINSVKTYDFGSAAKPDKTTITVTYKPSGSVSNANLNYLTVNYQRSLRMRKLSQLLFRGTSTNVELGDADASTNVWDVTNPLAIRKMNLEAYATSSNFPGTKTVGWRNEYSGTRNYVAWNPSGSFPAPVYVERVNNQDIHGQEVPDMIIFVPSEWQSQAERIAQFHRNDPENPLTVLVLDQKSVFNEFGSGSPDAQTFRKALKMFYDRSDSEHQLQYALFFGRGIYDNRRIVGSVASLAGTYMPIWESESGSSDSSSYTTDDIYAFLEDGSGVSTGTDIYCIAVGRMPVVSLSEATVAVDKLMEYVDSKQGDWQNRVLLIADDQDSGVHMTDTEKMWVNMLESDGGADMTYRKIYTDAYPMVGGGYPDARNDLFKTLDEGVVWWTFIGHANTTSWTHENLMTYTDFNNLRLKHYPIIYAATCDFLRVDASAKSAAEIVWLLESGGAAAVISANRPVYISDNGVLSRAFGGEVFRRDQSGRRQTLGQIYRNAKNANLIGSKKVSDTNKLRYLLVGDPAMFPHIPDYRVVVDKINGVAPDDPNNQAIMMARQNAVIEGHLVGFSDEVLEEMDGTIDVTLYDADYSTVSKANGSSGVSVTFEQQGERIYAGSALVKNGRFKLNVAMPAEISNNFREATANFIFRPVGGKFVDQAAGVNRDFYVYGLDETTPADTIAPKIESFYLNHPSFVDGAVVNLTPMAIATVSDNRGINMSNAGVGHQLTLQLDGNKTYTDVARFYTPSADDPAKGTIAYPLDELQPGEHTLRLRIWDTDGNSCSSTLTFYAREGATPNLYEVYTDTNPASVQANFYLSHDRPDSTIEVTISVFNLLGQPVWSTTTEARSDMFLTYPVVWNLTDHAGRRVPRGIYIYRASIKADGQESQTQSKKLAVTAQ